jgi:cyclopropane fatty-acyl-phospholipid synthase-like methyltransferase
MLAIKDFWDNVFETKSEKEVSWFQPYPKTSIEFMELFNLPLDANIIDIGGGDSHLVDVLIEKGFKNIFILDISEIAIEKVKKRLGKKATLVNWIVINIIDFKPNIKFDFWHDRAAFHFLTTEENIKAYINIAENNITQNGYLILGTFSNTGPEKCSGLEIKRYSESSMSVRFENQFERIKCITEDHQTPFNTTQSFVFCSFKKKSAKSLLIKLL